VHRGQQQCTGGQWGECLGQILPTPETCNGLDDDCNGGADDPFFADTNPACSTFYNTPTRFISGDTPGLSRTVTGTTETWFRVRFTEDSERGRTSRESSA
jgi:hypothetical protein